ncbi:metal-dependent transcriptional regulator [bacterium]|nr:metal-dependent transcriptional regulator [bacterium]MCB2179400.1 metal-dependent transcriptional regulator [bacterium]
MQSENAEMYLVTMAMLEESGASMPIPIPRLAEALEVQTVSANQMVRKLEEDGLVSYLPYKGVSFTEEGSQLVQTILRHRRLWEVFFVEKLGFSPGRADALACRVEHITEPDVAARLAELLDHPTTSPTGKRIPSAGKLTANISCISLTNLQPGIEATVYALNVEDVTAAYLMAEQLSPGASLMVDAVSSSGAVLVTVGSRKLSLSEEIANQILVARDKGQTTHAE